MASDSSTRYLSTVQVADAVGVSVSTIKRWVDDGVLPARRTAGGHRKLLLADVLRVVRDAGLPQPDAGRLLHPADPQRPPDVDVVRRQLAEAVGRVDAEQIRAVFRAAQRARVPFDVLADRVIGPVMTAVGTDWEAGRIDVASEHRVTQLVLLALGEWSGQVAITSSADRPVAVGGATELDPTMLPSLFAKLTLEECGWEAVNLGPHTPVAAFLAAIDRLRPTLVWVSVTHLPSAERFQADYMNIYRAAKERGAAVAVGGRGLTGEQRSSLPYTSFGDGMGHLAAFARSLHPLPRRPTRGRPRKHSD
jgi:excisionase family DNA binding protein